MPGIFGSVSRNGENIPESQRVQMIDAMNHDDYHLAEWDSGSCFLGGVELRNLPDGKTLVYDNGKSVAAVSRGNIFNKLQLCQTYNVESTASYRNDAKFIVKLYEKLGLDFPRYLNGLFLIALYDKTKDMLIIVNDRFGYFPLFYCASSERFNFASEAKTVLKDPAFTTQIDKNAIPEFFAFSYVLGEKTFFKDVKLLKPAQILVYSRKDNMISTRQYWDFTRKQYDQSKPVGSYLRQFNELMEKAVKTRVQDLDHIGIFLSGGLDSRVIAAFASETKKPITTYTFGLKNCEEQRIASEVSEKLGIENVFCEIPDDFIANFADKIVYNGDGLIRIRDCHFISYLQKIKKTVHTVLLGTFGGDLTCRPEGRLSEKFVKMRKKENIIDFLLNYYTSFINNVLPLEKHREAFQEAFFQEIDGKAYESFGKTFKEIKFESAPDIGDYWEYRNREPRYIFQASQNVNWFLETRHPYMDNDLVDFFAFRFPPSLRRREILGITFEDTFLQKALIQRFPVLSKVPWHGFPPDSSALKVLSVEGARFVRKKCFQILGRLLHKKMNVEGGDFKGYDEWLRSGSKEYALNLLLDIRTLKRPYFREDFVKKILQDHMGYKANHDQLILDMINLELLHRMFLDQFRLSK